MRKWGSQNFLFWMDWLADCGSLRPSRLITQLAWRPLRGNDEANGVTAAETQIIPLELAVASEDHSLRLFTVSM